MTQPKKKVKPKKSAHKKALREKWPRIRKTVINEVAFYVVDPRPFKKREYFAEKTSAETRADQLEIERLSKGIESVEFSSELRMLALEADAILRPFHKTIRDAALHYAAFLEGEKKRLESPLVKDCLEKWLHAKRTQTRPKKLRKTTLNELESRARLFASAWGEQRVSEITRSDVETFLDAFSDPQYVKNLRTKAGQFFNFCIERLHLPIENPVKDILIAVPASDVEILTVEACTNLLKCALSSPHAEYVVPYIAIEMFAGLRPGEADQLVWEKINFNTNEIEVNRSTTKVLETRFVPINPTCSAWLEKFRRKSGLVAGANFRKKWNQVRAEAGYALLKKEGDDWISDVLRHCFGSNWLAVYKDRARLAEIMGNSIETIKKHYRRAIPEAEGNRFWALLPSSEVFSA